MISKILLGIKKLKRIPWGMRWVVWHSHLGWNLSLVLYVMTMGRLTAKTKSPF